MRLTKTEEKFIEAVDEYNKNSERIGGLSRELDALNRRNTALNGEICLLCELLGIKPEYVEYADRIADDLRKRRDAA